MIEFLFSPEGRIGRGAYWGGFLLHLVFGLVVLSFMGFGIANKGVFIMLFCMSLLIPSAWSGFCLAAKRFHDRGKSAWWYLGVLVPILGLWFAIELLFFSGDEGDNDYGPPPSKARRMATMDDDVSKLATIDDEYFKKHMEKIALEAGTQPATGNNAPRAAFGKRA